MKTNLYDNKLNPTYYNYYFMYKILVRKLLTTQEENQFE